MPNPKELLKNQILILDGAMGTMIQQLHLPEEKYQGKRFENHPCKLKGNFDLLSITQPEIIKQIHREYLQAGADIIETNTFRSNSIDLAHYQMEDLAYELNLKSAQIAKEVAADFSKNEPNKPRFVAGSIGPTHKSVPLSSNLNNSEINEIPFVELHIAYQNQIKGLMDGGCDLLLIETVFNSMNTKAALLAIQDYNEKNNSEIPVMLSFAINNSSGELMSGETLETLIGSFADSPLLSIGFNCDYGAKNIDPQLKYLSSICSLFVSYLPNAGQANDSGIYAQSIADFSSEMENLLKKGYVNIIGGCCGTSPTHIKALSEIALNYSPRKIQSKV